MVAIHIIQGPDKGRTFELPDRENVVGRQSPTAELNDSTVSRRHLRLFPENGKWIVEDLGSANGTYLNGVRLRKAMDVHRGDQIRCGATLLVFGGQGRPAPVELDAEGNLVDAAIVATVPSNEDSVVIPTPEANAQAVDNLRFLYDLTGEISSIFNVDLLLQRVLDRVFDVLKADRGYILLIEEGGNPIVRASRAGDPSTAREIPISWTMINEVIGKQVGVLSSNAMSDKRFESGKSVHDFGIRSAVCVPIKGRGRVIGVIHLDSSVSRRTYSTEQLRLLTAVGYQTGLAVENVNLHEATVQAERLAAVGETVAHLSHHIKNILQALAAGTDVVKSGLDNGQLAKARENWPIVERSLGRINDLILNMLAFSKDRRPSLEPVNVNHVLTECLETITPQADDRNVAVLTELDDLPPIPADAAGLHQAFMNLLTNALDAVDQGAGAVTVASRYDSMRRNVIVTVADNGSGIPEDQLTDIFNPFWSSKGQKGTGLGLAVTRKLVEEHHGRIEVHSAVDEGTTFTVTLPAVEATDAGETHGPADTA